MVPGEILKDLEKTCCSGNTSLYNYIRTLLDKWVSKGPTCSEFRRPKSWVRRVTQRQVDIKGYWFLGGKKEKEMLTNSISQSDQIKSSERLLLAYAGGQELLFKPYFLREKQFFTLSKKVDITGTFGNSFEALFIATYTIYSSPFSWHADFSQGLLNLSRFL